MSLASQIAALAQRVGEEFKTVRAEAVRWRPSDYGARGWTTDPQMSNIFGPVIGRVYTARAKVEVGGTISNVQFWVNTAGNANTAIYVGIYALDGTLLASSTDQKAVFLTTGSRTVPMQAATPTLVAGQEVVVAYLTVGGTTPIIGGTASAPGANINKTASGSNPLRQAFSVATGVTTLPSPMNHASYQTSGNALLALLLP